MVSMAGRGGAGWLPGRRVMGAGYLERLAALAVRPDGRRVHERGIPVPMGGGNMPKAQRARKGAPGKLYWHSV